jgi:hypothetical protein
LYFLPIFSNFFSRPWFKRIWVIQEAFFESEVFVRCGRNVITWSAAFTIGHVFEMGRSEVEVSQQLLEEAVARQSIPHIWSWPKFEHRNILELINDTRTFEASDPRDRLFALYGISVEARNVMDLPQEVQPDYNKPVHEVFAGWIIKESHSLDILAYSGLPCDDVATETQSWIPDWTSRTNFNTLLNVYDIKNPGACLESFKERSVLALRGLRVDSIDYICVLPMLRTKTRGGVLEGNDGISVPLPYGFIVLWYFLRSATEKELTQKIYHSLGGHSYETMFSREESFQTDQVPAYPSGGNLLQSFYFTLTSKYLPSSKEFPWFSGPSSLSPGSYDSDDTTDEQRDRNLASGFASAWLELDPAMKLAPLYSDSFRELSSTEAKDKLIDIAISSCYEKYFVTTSEGYIGLCPSGSEPGDIIVFLYGGKTPYVLREKNSKLTGSLQGGFEFIGECFIYGYMEPGIVDALKLRYYPEEIFGLC